MEEAFNKLTPAEAERLSLLAEECGEVVKAIMKIFRHGYESDWNGQLRFTNRQTLADEIGNVLFAAQCLIDRKDVDVDRVSSSMNYKILQINKYLHHNIIEG